MVRDFKRAWETKDIEALIGLLDPQAIATADGAVWHWPSATQSTAASRSPTPGMELATHGPALTLQERTVNGQPALVAQLDGTIVSVYAFDITDGRITRIWAIRNPEKLRPWVAS
ncbi:hypothetical protein OIE68_31695 [Nocardia vinacea]|uniref:hypothetical protein n=1 Tax=Nocardia vinacea TaxID=96468 RepID=UPI002E11498D|nr:hypothetical protein OIE68_31695 [Nocardia vinacea]